MEANILVVDDEKLIRWSLEKEFQKKGHHVRTAASAKEVREALDAGLPDLVLLDIQLPDGNGVELLPEIKKRNPLTQVIMITANDQVSSVVECMKRGAFHYLHKPFQYDEVHLLSDQALEMQRLRKKIGAWESAEKSKYDCGGIIGDGPAMTKVKELVRQIAESEARTVLFVGESGTGKDLAAKAIHYAGPKAGKPFLTVNCAAIPATLLESELFGHERGAFTDAREAKKGLVEEAADGTLFLDEIGDMPKEMQAKLLHLIENKKFRRVGSTVEKEVDLRIVAATNRNLKRDVADGRFREDLFYRLNVIPVALPPLRDRKEDIPDLVGYFIAHFNREFRKQVTGIDPKALNVIACYDWPGNVRELKNVIERAMILNSEQTIKANHLPSEIDSHCAFSADDKAPQADVKTASDLPQCLAGIPLDTVEKHAVALAMKGANGNQSRAADVGHRAGRTSV